MATSKKLVGQSRQKIGNTVRNKCLKTSVTATAEVDGTTYQTTFEMDPMKCFNSNASLKFEEREGHAIIVDVTKDAAFHEKFFQECRLDDIKIFTENDKEVQYEKVKETPNRVKISTLDRKENTTLTIEYNFEGGMKRTKKLFVPFSQSLVQQEAERKEKERKEKRRKNKRRKA